ncbi:hypothetical protein ACX9NE_14730 [Mycobacterium sp. ML4]
MPEQRSVLAAILAQDGPLDPARAVNVVRQIAAAIDDAHGEQAIHRDVRPTTIVLTRAPSGEESAYLVDATPSTETTRALVTNTEATRRADIIALTAVLYECLTGHPPSPLAQDAPVPRPSKERTDLPSGFDDVVVRGLSSDPGRGYRTAAELAAAAERALSATPGRPASPSQAQTRVIDLPARPSPPPSGPWYAQSPTVSFPHSRPVPLPPPPPTRRRYLAPIIATIAIAVAVAAGAIAIPRLVHHPAAPASTTPTPAHTRHSYTAQPAVLPFPGLQLPDRVDLDSAGNVYLLGSTIETDSDPFDPGRPKLLKLAAGSNGTTTIDFPGVDFRSANDMVVDAAGNVYLSDGWRVWELPVGAQYPLRLPFQGFVTISAITIDAAGNAYAAGPLAGDEALRYGVKKLVPGDTRPTDLSFPDLYMPRGIAVDKHGDVYVAAGNRSSGKGRVLRLAAGTTTPTEVFTTGLIEPRHTAFDSAGNVFITDGYKARMSELPAGSTNPISIPLPARSYSVAFDPADNLYAATLPELDKNDRVVNPGHVLKIAPSN